MAEETSNPYKVKKVDTGELRRITPFRPEGASLNPIRDAKLRTVADMQLSKEALASASQKIRDLTVSDLEDLAKEMAGVPSYNPKIADMTVEDIQDLEGLFFEYKRARIDILERQPELVRPGGVGPLADNVDCCCCTPCCCCAAVETDPFAR